MTYRKNAEDGSPVTIRATGISKIYGDFVAITDVSFEARRGTVTAFLGPNGAGKSTTMKILTGYLAATTGSTRVLDLDPADPEQRLKLTRRLGYLPENGPLYLDMTPSELLRFLGTVRKIEGLDARIDRVVSQCAISSVFHKPIGKLSKGFRQRVGMAQALLADPEVMIMDEPTSGLDPLQIREMRTLIRELGETKTILLSTHILQEVDAVADQVLMILEGRMVFDGSLEDLKGDQTIEDAFYRFADAATEGKSRKSGKSKKKTAKEVA